MARIDLVDLAHSYGGNDADPKSFALKPGHDDLAAGRRLCAIGAIGLRQDHAAHLISGHRHAVAWPDPVLTASISHTLSTRERNIAQVFQFPVIYDTMTVGQNLAFPLRNRGVPKAEIDTRVAQIAQLLDLTPDLNRKATRLTADAKQKSRSGRGLLGRGLVRSDVAAVLFDEPLTVIDPELKWQLRSKLKGAAPRSRSDDDLCHP